MKKSEELHLKASQEDNDFRALGLHCMAFREQNLEEFQEAYEKFKPHIVDNFNGSKVVLKTAFGIVDFYPKANKVLIRSGNQWKKNGYEWLVKTLGIS